MRGFIRAALAIWVSGAVVVGQRPEPELLPSLRDSTVRAVADVIDREYFDPDVAARVKIALNARGAEGRYAHARTRQELAEALTRDLLALTGDKHLVLTVAPPRSASVSSSQPNDERAVAARRANYGVQRLEVLSGNVGYLNLTSFYRPDEARETLAAAMRVLRSADGLILDMRENSGGSPDTVALLLSYLFEDEALPLFEIVRRDGQRERYTTLSPGLGDRDGKRPIYVLTSAETFSAGEGLAFILQERRRAEVVGEGTAGAANPGGAYRVNDSFEVVVPNGQVRTAVSGRNWEGKGVTADITVSSADALRVAHARALSRLAGGR